MSFRRFPVFISTFSFWLLLAWNMTHGFRPTTTTSWIGALHRTSPTKITSLFYQANATADLPDTGTHVVRGSDAIGTSIPVIGPLYHPLPLVIGTTFWLDPPTPLQWKTLEVCVDAWKDRHGDLATLDAAPLVAVLEKDSQLAVIAAILGYQSSTTTSTADGPRLDTWDAASFRESLAGLTTVPYYKDTAKVRLLCIGRAKLSDYWQMTATNHPPGSQEDIIDHTWEENDERGPSHNTEPVLMATMQLILDTSTTRQIKASEFGSMSSPVHALSQLSMWSSRLSFLHNDRQKLAQGIQAIQTRLELLSEEWQDWDGIGTLYDDSVHLSGKKEKRCHNMPQDCVLRDQENLSPQILYSNALSPEAARLLTLENYGLGTTSSAYCDLHTLTKVLLEILKPYYSPKYTSTEEFEYCLFSWVAMQSLIPFLHGTRELNLALTSSNTVDRMHLLYEFMSAHKEALKELATAKSKELRDCGEECDVF
jgi:hypothetical protein